MQETSQTNTKRNSRTESDVGSFLALFATFNAILLSGAAILDERTPKYVVQSFVDRGLHNYWIFAEAALIVILALFGTGLIRRFFPTAGMMIGVAMLGGIPLVWYFDRLSRITMDEPLVSRAAMSQLQAFLPWLRAYTTWNTFAAVFFTGLVFVTVQSLFIWLSIRFTRHRLDRTPSYSSKLFPAYVVLILALTVPLLAVAMRNPTHVAHVYRNYPVRHPVCMFGIVESLMPPRFLFEQQETTEIVRRLDDRASDLRLLQERYAELKLSHPGPQPPDILLVMVESFRFDAIAMPQAPHLSAFQEQCLVGTRHFSGGNASQYGLFTLLSGLDAGLMSRARHWPMALPRLMKQAGYFNVFLGSGPFEWMDMSDFLKPEQWDVYRDEYDVHPFYRRDEMYIRHATDLFDRRREAQGHSGAVCVMLCPYTTHWDYHFAKDDLVLTPSMEGNLWWPPHPGYDKASLRNRYFNSVHALDRLIAPLLDKDRVIVIVGDHGEAIFDYGTQLVHANSISPAQTQTPLIAHIPGASPKRIRSPTHHADILPTLVDVIGGAVNHGEVLSGISLLDRPSEPRRFMLGNAKNDHFALFAPYATERGSQLQSDGTLNMVQWSDLDLWTPSLGKATVHDEAGRFKQTLGACKDPFLVDFYSWLDETVPTH